MCTLGFFQHRSGTSGEVLNVMMHVESSSYLAGTQYSSNMFPCRFTQAQSMLKLASQLESADWLIVDAQ